MSSVTRSTARHDTDALMRRIAVEPSGCWTWTGTVTTQGYGQVGWHGRRRQAHRVLYEVHVGPVPGDMTLDHLCRNRRCVNPAHLEPVSNHENILRGAVPSMNRSLCKNGVHDITGPGSIYTDSDGVERCHECRLESKRRYRARAARQLRTAA